MSIRSDWQAIESALEQQSPRVRADLRPPITETQAAAWSEAVGELPASLRELYDVHAGTASRGAGGFCFIGNWYPLSVDEALARYERCRRMTDLWGRDPLIPFAVDPTGSHLGVHAAGSSELNIMFDDTPEMPYEMHQDIEALVAATAGGLRGDSTEYRAELTDQYLSWINLEEEADDLGY
jgi:hypothetical protein